MSVHRGEVAGRITGVVTHSTEVREASMSSGELKNSCPVYNIQSSGQTGIMTVCPDTLCVALCVTVCSTLTLTSKWDSV